MRKSFTTALKIHLCRLFSLQQALTRQQYIVRILMTSLICLLLLMVVILVVGQGAMLFLMQNQQDVTFWSAASFGLFYFGLLLVILGYLIIISIASLQRLRDLQFSAWWGLLLAIPFLNVMLIFILLFLPRRITAVVHST